MNGMKEGTGDDPFADDDPLKDKSEEVSSISDAPDPSESKSRETSREQTHLKSQIPYKLRRNGIQDGRDRLPVFVQSDTQSEERDALRELEDRFDENVSVADLREAALKIGFQHIGEVEVHLEEWGYGMSFDE